MKINEVAIREAEPNYEVDPAQSRLAAIANKLMEKSKTVSDINLANSLSKVAYHLSDYGTSFGPKTMQQLLDMVNGEGKYAPDADMPQDNKNPIKVTKETLMKMMDFGQKMLDKEGPVKADDVEESIEEDTEGREKENARKMRKRLTDLRFDVADIEANIGELRHLDNGDLTDQVSTMMKYSAGLYSVLTRAMKIVPVYEMNESERSPAMIAKIKKWHDELEDNNHHGEAALLLVNAFGDKQDLDVINAINARHKKRGSISMGERTLRDEIANQYYKMLTTNEGVMSDLFKSTTDEKRQKRRTGDMYDQMKVERETKKFEKQGLSPEDARKYAYRKVHGKPVNEVAGPEKCWDGYKKVGTKPGTGKNKGKRVNDCEKA
jgi:hypothetical protein